MYISTALQVAFDQAVADAGPLLQSSHHATALSLYALYQQATLGDLSEARPGFGDFAARARWDAWQALQGTPSSLAMQDYVELVASLKAAHRSPATG